MYATAEITILYENGHRATYYRKCSDEMEIYDLLEPFVGHEFAEEAAAWAVFAGVGDYYYDEKFEIKIIE